MGVEDCHTLSSEYLFVDPEVIINQKQYVPFAELTDIEARRRKILKRTELPFWRILGSLLACHILFGTSQNEVTALNVLVVLRVNYRLLRWNLSQSHVN